MAEEDIRDTRASSPPSGQFLAAPVINSGRGRSSSAAPSFRSFQSHITTFEEKEDIQSVDSLHSNETQVQRQQTFKIGRSVSLMDRVKGVFFPSILMAKIENSIEVVKSDVPNDEMFHRQPSPWIVDVHVSRKADSRDYHKTLCLLDTGCSHGNIVSKELVWTLGFTETDYQELSELERQGGVTMSGEPFLVEAAIFLSWHHNSSLKRFHRMRFLVASQGKNFDMIIGAQTICKYELMSRPVFGLNGLNNGIVKSSGSANKIDPVLTNERAALKNDVVDMQEMIDEEKRPEKLPQLKAELSQLKHLLSLKETELSREQAKNVDKHVFDEEIEKQTKAWDDSHPKNSTTKEIQSRYKAAHEKKSTSSDPDKSKAANVKKTKPSSLLDPKTASSSSKGVKRSQGSTRGRRSSKP